MRVFNRALTVQEAKVVFEWRALQGTRAKSPEALTGDERELLLGLHYLSVEDDGHRRLVARKQEIELEWREVRRRGSITHVMQESPTASRTHNVLHRGMYDQKLERVTAGTPAALPPMAASLPRNRLGLARWLVDETNPLTSRVIVNRFWQQLFGTGLVATSDDFADRGRHRNTQSCSNWLAVEFRDSGLGRQAALPHAGDLDDLPAVGADDTGEDGGGTPRTGYSRTGRASGWMPRWCVTTRSPPPVCSCARSAAPA